jgi:hypothetical protein
MTKCSDLAPLVGQYRAGLDAEMKILSRLDLLAREQQALVQAGELAALPPLVEERDRLMATLVSIEAGLKPVRMRLAAAMTQLTDVIEFQQVKILHREAAALASAILRADGGSLEALREAEFARRAAAQTLDQGESTLAAYRRASLPSPSPATLVDRRG